MKTVHDMAKENQLLKLSLQQMDLSRRDVDVIRDDPNKPEETIYLKPGEREVIIFDATTAHPQHMTVYNFDPHMDAVLFSDMRGQDLYVAGQQFPGPDGHPQEYTTLTPAAHTDGSGPDPTPDHGVLLVGQPYNFDLYQNSALWPRNSYDIHFNGTIIS